MIIKNKFWILAIILLMGFIVNSCDGDDDNYCPICKSDQHCYTHCVNENCPIHNCENHNIFACDICTPKCEHKGWAIDDEAEPCGKYGCICGPKVYCYINSIPVYRVKAVSDEQMSGVFEKLEAAYNGMNPTYKPKINAMNVAAFHMISVGGTYNKNSKIFTLMYSFTTNQMIDELDDNARFEIAQLQQKYKAIRMVEAKVFSNIVTTQLNIKGLVFDKRTGIGNA